MRRRSEGVMIATFSSVPTQVIPIVPGGGGATGISGSRGQATALTLGASLGCGVRPSASDYQLRELNLAPGDGTNHSSLSTLKPID